jgi:hypothetical protein
MSLDRNRSTCIRSGEQTFDALAQNGQASAPPLEQWGFVAADAAARLPGAPDWTKISTLRMFWLT